MTKSTPTSANVKTVVEPAAPLAERFVEHSADAGFVAGQSVPVITEATLSFGQGAAAGYEYSTNRYGDVRRAKIAELRARIPARTAS